ncbi:MAG: HAMP domain-containing protein [Opitutaceae bacterium]|nr:HAMP domain-containing protein [Opitutaceae bacterium]
MLRTRLTLGLLPLLLLFIAVCLYAFRTSQELADSVGRLLGRTLHSIQVTQELRETATRMNEALDPAGRDSRAEASRRFEVFRSQFKRRLNDELLARPGSARIVLLDRIDEQFQRFTQAGEAALRSGPLDTLELYNQAQAVRVSVNNALDQLRERNYQEIHTAELGVKERTNETLRLFFFAMIAAVGLSFFLAWRLAGGLLGPIKALTVSAVALGEGDLAHEVPETSRDELGQLAKAFNTMAAHLRAYREATMAKVLRTQRTMEATLTSTPDPVFVVSTDGQHTVRNPAAEQLAQSPEFAHGFPPALAGQLAEVFATGEHYLPTDYRRIVTLRAAREDRHYLPRILAIGDKLTEFKGAAVILQDVTKFRLLDDVKTNLVGTVSHELKTPLTSLRMAIYLLLEQNVGALAPKQRELLETARDDADRLLRILDNLLDLTRLEGGASTLDCHEITVATLLNDIAAEARAFIESAGQKLLVVVEPDLAAGQLSVDVDRVRHVFINLLANASKYSPAGGTITLTGTPAPLGFVRFAVRDQGPGVPPESVTHVFDRFYRAPGQTPRPGAGLGLAIAREIVVAHGGSIACTSEPGKGSEFYFLLPR